MSQNTDQTCENVQVTSIDNQSIFIGKATCADFKAGDVSVTQNSNCQMTANLSATAKATADQTASATNGGGHGASAQNQVSIQQSIEQNMSATCGAQQNTSISNQTFDIGDIKGIRCEIGLINASQNSLCVTNMTAQASENGSATQNATTHSTSGFETMLVNIAIIAAIVLVAFLFFKEKGEANVNKSQLDYAVAMAAAANPPPPPPPPGYGPPEGGPEGPPPPPAPEPSYPPPGYQGYEGQQQGPQGYPQQQGPQGYPQQQGPFVQGGHVSWPWTHRRSHVAGLVSKGKEVAKGMSTAAVGIPATPRRRKVRFAL